MSTVRRLAHEVSRGLQDALPKLRKTVREKLVLVKLINAFETGTFETKLFVKNY